MERLIYKYSQKLVESGLAERGAPIMGALDAELLWNRDDRLRPVLESVFGRLGINSLLFSMPAEPYRTIIDYLASRPAEFIRPNDTETRTFFHSLPVLRDFTAEALVSALKARKSAIVPGAGIVTFGTVSPEQAFITYCSVCFACLVKFFSDYLRDRKRAARKGSALGKQREAIFERVAGSIAAMAGETPGLMKGPFVSADEVHGAIEEAGRCTVRYGLVDSYFGNISYRLGQTLYISQTSSSLDELRGAIDPCALDGSSCAAITASSELSAHRQIVVDTRNKAVLHGHPPFAVILSLDCERDDCAHSGSCHRRCPQKRSIADIPVVSGEVGTGPYGLCHTVPKAIRGKRGVIVHGHGVFAVGRQDFNEAFGNLLDIEVLCRKEYFHRVS